jgi:hypothetical protein
MFGLDSCRLEDPSVFPQFAEYMSRKEVRWAEIVRRSGARSDRK